MQDFFKAEKVADNVYWVGAVDWNVRNFHGYKTGRGSTYNAFLVIDEKVTLIDTVKAPFLHEMLARISSVIDPSKIAYIVSNHSEPDHSGALAMTIEAVKPEKVFASPMGEPRQIGGLLRRNQDAALAGQHGHVSGQREDALFAGCVRHASGGQQTVGRRIRPIRAGA